MKYNFIEWLKAAGVRSLKTVAQTIIAQIGVEAGIGIGEVSWVRVASVALLAGILSLLTSIAGLPELDLNPDAQIHKDTEPPEPIE